MSRTSYLTYLHLAYFSGPSSERSLYRQMKRLRPTAILEIGLGTAVRSLRILQMAGRFHAVDQIRYTGIDLFEARPESLAGLSIKDAYKRFRATGAQIKLVPGDVLQAMTQTANALRNTDLIVIDSGIEDERLRAAWKYFPRMMHERTRIFRQSPVDGKNRFQRLDLSDINRLVAEQKESSKRTAA